MLSKAKHLIRGPEMLRFAQHDTGGGADRYFALFSMTRVSQHDTGAVPYCSALLVLLIFSGNKV